MKKFFSPTFLLFYISITISLYTFCNSYHTRKQDFSKIIISKDAVHQIVKEKNRGEIEVKKIKDFEKLENVIDEISYANQLGRLDLVSLALTILSLVLGFGAVAGFLHIKDTSSIIAKDTAQDIVRDWLESDEGRKVIEEAVSKNLLPNSSYEV
jgi:hypothetical protein